MGISGLQALFAACFATRHCHVCMCVEGVCLTCVCRRFRSPVLQQTARQCLFWVVKTTACWTCNLMKSSQGKEDAAGSHKHVHRVMRAAAGHNDLQQGLYCCAIDQGTAA